MKHALCSSPLSALPRSMIEIRAGFGWVEPVQSRLMSQLLGTVHPDVGFVSCKLQEDSSLELCESSC